MIVYQPAHTLQREGQYLVEPGHGLLPGDVGQVVLQHILHLLLFYKLFVILNKFEIQVSIP